MLRLPTPRLRAHHPLSGGAPKMRFHPMNTRGVASHESSAIREYRHERLLGAHGL